MIKTIFVLLQTIPDFVNLAEGHAVYKEDTCKALSCLVRIEGFDEIRNVVSKDVAMIVRVAKYIVEVLFVILSEEWQVEIFFDRVADVVMELLGDIHELDNILITAEESLFLVVTSNLHDFPCQLVDLVDANGQFLQLGEHVLRLPIEKERLILSAALHDQKVNQFALLRLVPPHDFSFLRLLPQLFLLSLLGSLGRDLEPLFGLRGLHLVSVHRGD